MTTESGLEPAASARRKIGVLGRRLEYLVNQQDARAYEGKEPDPYVRGEIQALLWALPVLEAEFDALARVDRLVREEEQRESPALKREVAREKHDRRADRRREGEETEMGKASRTKRERREAKGSPEAVEVPQGGPIPEHLTPDVELAKQRKVDAVEAKEEGGTDDLVPWLGFYREDRLVATVICRNIDRDQALDAAWVGIPGYDADEVRLCMDSHISAERGPRPGERWQPGQMQRLCDEEGACEIGLITDTLWIMRMLRTGGIEWVNLPYHVHKTARTVRWIEPENTKSFVGYQAHDEAIQLGGLVPDVLRDAFAKEPLSALLGRPLEVPEEAKAEVAGLLKQAGVDPAAVEGGLRMEHFGLDPDRARVHEDCAVTRLLMETGKYAVMLPAYSDEDAAIISRSMERVAGVEKVDLGREGATA